MSYLEPVSESYISEVISKSTAKSSWLDPPPTTVVKQSAGALGRPLTKIVHVSITTGTFPSSLKKGALQPTLKKPTLDLEQYSSYRPITNIAFLSKTIEHLTATQASNYLTDNDLLPNKVQLDKHVNNICKSA